MHLPVGCLPDHLQQVQHRLALRGGAGSSLSRLSSDGPRLYCTVSIIPTTFSRRYSIRLTLLQGGKEHQGG